MKAKCFVMLAMLISCVFGVNGVWADTALYIDNAQICYVGLCEGVVHVEYGGIGTDEGAIFGYAHAGNNQRNYGGYFRSDSTNGLGVWGVANATSGQTYGGSFRSYSTSGTGVAGYASATTGPTYAGYFEDRSTSGKGIFSWASATTGTTYGGYFENDSTQGMGVFIHSAATSGNTAAGYFYNQSTAGRAVVGVSSATTGETNAGYFLNYSTNGKAVLAYAGAASGPAYGGYFQSDSTGGLGVVGITPATSGVNFGVFGQSNSPSGYGVFSQGNLMVTGNAYVLGSKSSVAPLKSGKKVALYAVESAENWFEDFGSARLKEGKAEVTIDPTFAETVNTGMEYPVFLTPNGDCRGLYVTKKTDNTFEVKELNSGNSDISFSYRIVAKRKGFEGKRLAEVQDDTLLAAQGIKPQSQVSLEAASHVK